MLSTRVIPCLLLKDRSLVKSIRFKNHSYVGDPVNTVRIFNEKEVDELILLDILATPENRAPNYKLISEIAGECFMPLTYGGGVRMLSQAEGIFNLGVEKIVINSYAVENPSFIEQMASSFGSQSVVISIDAKKNSIGNYEVYTYGGRRATGLDPVNFAVTAQKYGAGEIMLTSIDRDGTFDNYDIELIKRVTCAVNIPVIACGGAGKIEDLAQAVKLGGASAAAAGCLFVYQGKSRAVLINFPERNELEAILS